MLACCGAFGPLEVGLRLSSGGGSGGALAVKRLPALLGAQVSRLMVQLLQLRHTNVLQYALCIPNRCASQPEVLLATSLCECNLGELLVLLKADGSLGQRAHGLVRQLLSGLHYLHTLSTPVVHGNLKPSNVLIDDKGVVRLAEFGLHQMLYQTTPPPASSVIWWSCETCVAYEQNRRMSCSTMSDIQVAGMVVHFILTGGNHPFGTEASQIVQNIRRGFNAPATTNCEANDLISWMVLQNPGQRPSVEKVIRHIYFWDTEKKWKFLLTCAGMSPDCKTAPLPLSNFFACLEKQAAYHNTKGDWVSVVRTFLPEIAPSVVSYSNTPVGLLNFMRDCLNSMQNMDIQTTTRLQQFFVAAFPGLSLTLYRFIEKTDWLRHPALAPFVDGTNY
ncbi:serine/threonine-protein kinase/endoribonuclease IRE2-like [Schistocerca gregaria]|uniref:serine/threonine-protein kinase/endoribonuclease IRE2-like n=1 Tax=Schistocerca gregaria TaxID=7010 RepID=UPI00211EA90D|nr:serine/threonine-protein kinase/endoribonuclease IRE2-like [Schistocerca gregaria]